MNDTTPWSPEMMILAEDPPAHIYRAASWTGAVAAMISTHGPSYDPPGRSYYRPGPRPKAKHKRPYKGSKAAKKASRG